MLLTHYNTLERAEAYLAQEGFFEIAINTWRDDHGQTATVSPFLGNVVHVQFERKAA